jgi:hypothetical protein
MRLQILLVMLAFTLSARASQTQYRLTNDLGVAWFVGYFSQTSGVTNFSTPTLMTIGQVTTFTWPGTSLGYYGSDPNSGNPSLSNPSTSLGSFNGVGARVGILYTVPEPNAVFFCLSTLVFFTVLYLRRCLLLPLESASLHFGLRSSISANP